MKDALRSGDLYLPQSRQHVSFWNLMLDQHHWQNNREVSYEELQQPYQDAVKSALILQLHQSVSKTEKCFGLDTFAEIKDGKLKLKKTTRRKYPIPS
jgi:hypothetical protein